MTISEETRKKLSLSKIGPKNGMWKGNNASTDAARIRARRIMSSDGKLDIHHIDGNPYNNDPKNLKPTTRREHMIMDGRLERLIARNHQGLQIKDHNKFIGLYNSGLIDHEIAAIFNITRRVVCSYRKKYNLPSNRGKRRRGRPLVEREVMTPEETVLWKYKNRPIGTDSEKRVGKRRDK